MLLWNFHHRLIRPFTTDGVSERAIKRAERWKTDAYKPYTVNNTEDSRHVSRLLGDKEKEVKKQPGGRGGVGSSKE